MIRCRLKRLRLDAEEQQARKLTYHTLAEETGLSYGTIARMMSGEIERIEASTLDAVCAYFGCGVGDVLEYVPNKEDSTHAG